MATQQGCEFADRCWDWRACGLQSGEFGGCVIETSKHPSSAEIEAASQNGNTMLFGIGDANEQLKVERLSSLLFALEEHSTSRAN